MADMKLRRRHRLRSKEVTALAQELEDNLGCLTFSPGDILEIGEARKRKIVLRGGRAIAVYLDGEAFLTVHGLIAFQASKRWATVDMGAVKFIANGADVMAPGIIDVDPTVKSGEGVWIRDERNLRPLAIGIALIDAKEMIEAKDGKAIRTEHYVGDKLWSIGED